MEITLNFFVYAIDDPFRWPKISPRIQLLFNNTFSFTIGKTPYKIAYGFSSRKHLALYLAVILLDTYVAWIQAVDVISFALANQKKHYDKSHQHLFMKVGDWSMLKLHKGYLIFFSIKVTKKLTPQYIGPFQIVEKVGRLASKLDILGDWRIHLVFSLAQLESALDPTKNPF